MIGCSRARGRYQLTGDTYTHENWHATENHRKRKVLRSILVLECLRSIRRRILHTLLPPVFPFGRHRHPFAQWHGLWRCAWNSQKHHGGVWVNKKHVDYPIFFPSHTWLSCFYFIKNLLRKSFRWKVVFWCIFHICARRKPFTLPLRGTENKGVTPPQLCLFLFTKKWSRQNSMGFSEESTTKRKCLGLSRWKLGSMVSKWVIIYL